MVERSIKQTRRGRRGRRRAAKTAGAIAALGVLTLAGVSIAIVNAEVPSPVEGAPTIVVPQADGMTITWVGDTFLGDEVTPLLEQHGVSWPGQLLPALNPDDVVIANLEGPLTTRTEPFDPMQRWSYNADPATVQALTDFGIDAISMANNHAMDRGPLGLIDTVANASASGIASFGAGQTSTEARLPLLVKSGETTIAIAGFSDDGGLKTATFDRPGVRRLSPANLQADVDTARRAGADYVFAAVHWGGNYTALDDRQQTWAKAFADAGYDMVVGTGPHVVQPIAIIDGMPVVYSLGNYVFGTPGRFPEAEGFGLVLSTSFTPGGEWAIAVRCIETDNDIVNYQPRHCSPDQSAAILGGLNPSMHLAASTATMSVPLRSDAR